MSELSVGRFQESEMLDLGMLLSSYSFRLSVICSSTMGGFHCGFF